MIRFRFIIVIILFFSSVSQLAGQTTGCTKAKVKEYIQSGLSNESILEICGKTSKPEEKEKLIEEEKPKKIGQTTGCNKAKMREMIQKGLSNEEIVAACDETSKPDKKEKKKKKKKIRSYDVGLFFSTWGAGILAGYNYSNKILLGVDLGLGDSTTDTGGGSGISMKSETTFNTYNVFARYYPRDFIDGLFGQAGLALRSWSGKGSVIEDSTNAKIASIKMEWSPVVFVSGVGWHQVWGGLSFSVGINASIGSSRTIEYTENMQKFSDSQKNDLEEKTNKPTNLVIYIGYSF